MDRNLKFDQENFNQLVNEFNTHANQFENINFEVWTEIPEIYRKSYYKNELLINPQKDDYELWEKKLSRRPDPIYSVAINEDQVISSISGSNVFNERSMNLWSTNSEYRKKQIGKTVILNFIQYVFENDQEIIINAWDVTSKHVDDTLIKMGFR